MIEWKIAVWVSEQEWVRTSLRRVVLRPEILSVKTASILTSVILTTEVFGSYTRAERAKKEDHERISVLEALEDSLGYLTMGAASKIVASTFTYPLQVIKSRLQQRADAVDIGQDGKIRVKRREYKGALACCSKIYRNEGVLGFFKGWWLQFYRVAPSSAITFVVYEAVMDALGSGVRI